ncbi:MAG: putative T7SS-secreted protein [Actinomycetota bacterium]
MTELTAGAGATTLLPGNPESVRDLARRLETLAGGLDDAAVHLAAIQSGTWRGSAGDAFRSVLDEQPATFRRAAASFGQARVACTHYADVLEGAQRTAARAASEFD